MNHPKREKMITARVSAQEKKFVKQTAKRLGLTINSLIYDAVMKRAEEVGIFASSHPSGEKS